MNKAIVGSRTLEGFVEAQRLVTRLVQQARQQHNGDLVIISGGARGIDRMAEATANHFGVRCIIFPPKGIGVAALFARNDQIAEACDELDCIWDPYSKTSGCLYTVGKARRLGKKVTVHKVEGTK